MHVNEKLLNHPGKEFQGESTVVNMSMDGCSTENPRGLSSTAAKLRRTGSKLLSMVSFTGSSGRYL